EQTGLLVNLELEAGTFTPREPERFSRELAEAINRIASDPQLARRMGVAGRKRAEDHFSWDAIAAKTVELYDQLIQRRQTAV
ncbi:MAG: glycosyltransferase, partial [Alkalispirochaetaceae bacterium]